MITISNKETKDERIKTIDLSDKTHSQEDVCYKDLKVILEKLETPFVYQKELRRNSIFYSWQYPNKKIEDQDFDPYDFYFDPYDFCSFEIQEFPFSCGAYVVSSQLIGYALLRYLRKKRNPISEAFIKALINNYVRGQNILFNILPKDVELFSEFFGDKLKLIPDTFLGMYKPKYYMTFGIIERRTYLDLFI